HDALPIYADHGSKAWHRGRQRAVHARRDRRCRKARTREADGITALRLLSRTGKKARRKAGLNFAPTCRKPSTGSGTSKNSRRPNCTITRLPKRTIADG